MDSLSQTWNWLDWLIVGLLILGGVQGFRRGLLAMAGGLVGSLVGFWLAGHYADAVLRWADDRLGLVPRVVTFLQHRIHLPGDIGDLPLGKVPPAQLRAAVEALPLPAFYHRTLLKELEGMVAAQGSGTLGQVLFTTIAEGILEAVAFWVVMGAVGFGIAWGVRWISALADRLPLVGTANRALGALVGVVEVLLTLTVVAGLMIPLLSLPVARPLVRSVAQSQLVPWLLGLFQWLVGLLFPGAGGSLLSG